MSGASENSKPLTVGGFAAAVCANLPYAPNPQQEAVVGALARFCAMARRRNVASTDRVFVLNGYAGTGKTSLTAALVRTLKQVGVDTMLLAPTGRAAKVFSNFAGMPAYTIHRRIYRGWNSGEPPGLQNNTLHEAVFVVDEASMITDRDDPQGNNLLRDLLMYVFSSPGCCLIFVGDTAQLPPVGCPVSPAMDVETLRSYSLNVSHATLTAVARQARMSGILANATWQRRAMRLDPLPEPKVFTDGFDDVRTVTPQDLPEVISTAYSADGVGQTMVITRSNQRATAFNRAIRSEVLYYEDEIERGDRIMVAKNNYFWSREVKGLDFVANGDIATITEVYGTETRYGMRFADVRLELSDSGVAFEAKIMLDTLVSDAPALEQEYVDRLYRGIITDRNVFADDVPFEERLKTLRTNPYWNALQVKYAYCVTCHKAQGGQWTNVFVDMGYVPEDALGLEFYRWLYTATTRARSRLWMIRPEDLY